MSSVRVVTNFIPSSSVSSVGGHSRGPGCLLYGADRSASLSGVPPAFCPRPGQEIGAVIPHCPSQLVIRRTVSGRPVTRQRGTAEAQKVRGLGLGEQESFLNGLRALLRMTLTVESRVLRSFGERIQRRRVRIEDGSLRTRTPGLGKLVPDPGRHDGVLAGHRDPGERVGEHKTLICCRQSRSSYTTRSQNIEIRMLKRQLRCPTGTDTSCRSQTGVVSNARPRDPAFLTRVAACVARDARGAHVARDARGVLDAPRRSIRRERVERRIGEYV